jgi:hypothetical protein
VGTGAAKVELSFCSHPSADHSADSVARCAIVAIMGIAGRSITLVIGRVAAAVAQRG